MSKLGFVSEQSAAIKSIIKRCGERSSQYSVPDETKNTALKIAMYLQGKIPVLYSSTDLLDIVNLRWRGQFNENAKTLAFGNYLPEMNHNEIVGWQENPEILKQFALLFFKDEKDQPRIMKRMDITMDLIAPLAGLLILIDGEGSTKLERIFDMVYTGDWVSFYLAILNKIDPTPVEKINYLKNKLSES
jgi:glucose/mannose-6-phosphate isomerase